MLKFIIIKVIEMIIIIHVRELPQLENGNEIFESPMTTNAVFKVSKQRTCERDKNVSLACWRAAYMHADAGRGV